MKNEEGIIITKGNRCTKRFWEEINLKKGKITLNKNCLIFGKPLKNKLKLVKHKTGIADIDMVLDSYWGDHTVIIRQESCIYIFMMPCSFESLFFTEDQKNILFDYSIKNLAKKLSHELQPNIDYAKKYIAGSVRISSETPFEGIYRVPAGHAIKINDSNTYETIRIWPNFKVTKEINSKEFTEYFKEILKDYFNNELVNSEHLNILLSGGLDSTLLACAARKLTSDRRTIRALNVHDSRHAESDERDTATKTAEIINAELSVIDLKEHNLYSSNSDYKYLLNGFSNCFAFKEIKEVQGAFFKNGRVINGHGGDLIFNDIPNLGILNLDLIKFSRICSKISKCYNLSFFSVVKRAILEKINIYCTKQSYEVGKIDKNLFSFTKQEIKDNKNTVKPYDKQLSRAEKRLLMLIELCIEDINIKNSAPGLKETTPFLTKPVIECLLSMPMEEHFGTSRRPVEQQILESIMGKSVQTRFAKGFITSSMYTEINKNIKEHKKTIKSGIIFEHIINGEIFLNETCKSMKVGDISKMQSLIRLLQVELYYKDWREAL